METWIIELTNGTTRTVQCAAVGVSQEDSLIAFQQGMGQQPMAIEGWANGEWEHFYRSTLKPN